MAAPVAIFVALALFGWALGRVTTRAGFHGLAAMPSLLAPFVALAVFGIAAYRGTPLEGDDGMWAVAGLFAIWFANVLLLAVVPWRGLSDGQTANAPNGPDLGEG